MRSVLNKITGLAGPWIAKRTFEKELISRVHSYPQTELNRKSLKNILQINTLGHQGGAAKVAGLLSGSLNNLGYNSKLLVDQGTLPHEKIEQLPKVNSAKQKLLWNGQSNLGWLDFFHLSSFGIKNREDFRSSDIVHYHNLHGNYFSLFALPELTAIKPSVWTLHDMQAITGHCAHSFNCDKWISGCNNCQNLNIYPEIPKDTASFLWLHKKNIFKNCKITIVCPSKWLKDRVDQSILNNQKSVVIHNGVNTEIFKPTDKNLARKELGLPFDKKILLFSAHYGANNPFKGGHYLFHVYEKVKSRNDILFLNIGNDGKGSRNSNWIDVPYIHDEKVLALYYSAADLFIYPSLAETFGLVIAESFACETPVVTFNNTAIPELVKHLDNGYLAENHNPEELLKGIFVFLDNPKLLAESGRKARSLVMNNFTLDKMVSNYLTLYDEVLKNY